ncbi:hypothetical protein [Hymenobacter cheonanensis]|uniref:hypothetical protein n=1 Tax=Hymenobacter sp. CA2-7 TaxID=3063993 RepID=UPI002712260E|nr:hypothetical protein [Hymenobacter sp. CA2-7]MDO7888188.1 hypothetical protein [Hymenobacter sp. CA2-7]
MTEQQAQTATAVYGQLVSARQELARLRELAPLLSGVALHAPGMAPVRIEGLRAERLRCVARMSEETLASRIADLEQQLAQL